MLNFELGNNENNNIHRVCIFLPLQRVDISEFPQSQQAKLQHPLSNGEDEQLPP